jgi:hypothetical protein
LTAITVISPAQPGNTHSHVAIFAGCSGPWAEVLGFERNVEMSIISRNSTPGIALHEQSWQEGMPFTSTAAAVFPQC